MPSEPNKQPNGKRPAPNPAASPARPAGQPKGPLPKPPPLFRPVDWLAFGISSVVILLGYLYTLAPDLTLEDSGELAVASMYAGVPHPPGYPVWTIYTWFFTKLLPFSNIAWRVAVSSAFAGAVACGLIALMVSRGGSMFIESIAEFKTIERRVENWICLVTGLVAGMLMGFNGFMWSQAVIVEVYTLSVLSLTGMLCCLLRWTYAPHQARYLYFAWFLCGICFNNHQSLLVIVMAMEVLVIAVQAKTGRALLFWNSLFYIGGLAALSKGHLSLLSDNGPLLVIFNGIGLASVAGWIWLSVKTRLRGVEFARDLIVVLILAGIAGVLAWMANVISPTLGVLILAALGAGVAIYIALRRQTLALGRQWAVAFNSGLMFVLGAAFYVYMPLASMTNPPLNWGYPRTVAGFIHAFTRGQYERIHPTAGVGDNIVMQTVNWVGRYAQQTWMLVRGANEEFNPIYLLIGLVPLLFIRRVQPRERAWLIGLVAFYVVLGPLLLELLNPATDRQSISLNKVFFTASHVVIAMTIGYGLTLLLGTLITNYQRLRMPAMLGFAVVSGLALFGVAVTFNQTPYWVLRLTAIVGLVLAVGATLALVLARKAAPTRALLAVFLLMPVYSIFAHWSDNEQRGHLFGFWFGHDMFTPPFRSKDGSLTYSRKEREELMQTAEGKAKIYPEMTKDAILFGGTDPGRFCPTYMIFCESFVEPKDRRNPEFDRRDVYIITQNALADGTYLNYIRAHYFRSAQEDPPFFQDLLRSTREQELNFKTNLLARLIAVPLDNFFLGLGEKIEKKRRARGVYPPREIYTPSNEDSQRCFQEYMADAQTRMAKGQLKPGEDVRVIDNRVQVSGQVAVMAINGLLTKVIFDNNPNHEFFVEESFPLDWMYPHLTPFGIIMKINRQPLAELSEEVVRKDHEFWSDYSERLIGHWITYDTPVKEIAAFAERVYVNKDYSGFKGDPRFEKHLSGIQKFVRDEDGQKAFSKLRSSIAGVYSWRIGNARSQPEQERMFREAEFAFKQAYAFCPYSPEALYRYVNLLAGVRRFDDALLLAQTSRKLDPYNTQLTRLVEELQRLKESAGGISATGAPSPGLQKAESDYRANPVFSNAFAYAQAAASAGDTARVTRVADDLVANPNADAAMISFAMQIYAQLFDYPKLELALQRWTRLSPTPEAWLDLAGAQAVLAKEKEALVSLHQALVLNSQRLKSDPNASNIALSITGDTRFARLQGAPAFQALLATNR